MTLITHAMRQHLPMSGEGVVVDNGCQDHQIRDMSEKYVKER